MNWFLKRNFLSQNLITFFYEKFKIPGRQISGLEVHVLSEVYAK